MRAAAPRAATPAIVALWVFFRPRLWPGVFADMQDYLFESLGVVARPGRRCACSAATEAILSGSKILWQRCDLRSPVVDQGLVHGPHDAPCGPFHPFISGGWVSTRGLRK
ncbi:hypothetical protein GCM10010275_24920 [Streptomyces litmocidini]|nr:hypothetical protein GCM10010275_24920 [Streptomyces litmocidini]